MGDICTYAHKDIQTDRGRMADMQADTEIQCKQMHCNVVLSAQIPVPWPIEASVCGAQYGCR